MRNVWRSLASVLLITGKPVIAKEDKQIAALVMMTPEDFASRVDQRDEPLESKVKFDTSAGFQYKSGLLRQVIADIFLRSWVDRKTGAAEHKIYYSVQYDNSNWSFIRQANFVGPNGLEEHEVVDIGTDVKCGRYGCTYLETVGATISEADLRWLAASYKPGIDNSMKIRFKTKAGVNLDISIMPAEAAGLLKRIDAYRARQDIPVN